MRLAFFADINDNHNQKWLRRLVKDHSIFVFCMEHVHPTEHSLKDVPEITIISILPNPYSLKNFRNKWHIRNKIRRLLADYKIDLIHSIYAVPYAIWAHETGFPKHLITTYGSDVLLDYNVDMHRHKNFHQRVTNYLMRKKTENAFRAANYVSSTSIGQLNIVKKIIGNDAKLSVIRTGVNCTEFLEIYNGLKPDTLGNRTILSTRAMQELYNIHIIVDAFALLKQRMNDPKLKLVLIDYCTDFSYLARIREQIATAGLEDDVNIVPNLSTEELIQQYSNASVVVMIPKSDGTPVTGVETLLAAKPLIMGNLQYDTDLFNEQTVWQLRENNADALTAKWEEIIYLSEEQKALKTTLGRQLALEHANLDTEIAKIEELYRKIAHNE